MKPISYQTIVGVRRDYNAWVADETMEDYALRFAPRSFRKWSEFRVANTAFGSISFLMLEAIGGFLAIHYGFANACFAILTVGFIVFCSGLPISYYAARYSIDMDLLTRGAGFGYIGSTLTSLIYATFTFVLFALEASIMSLALVLYFDISQAWAHVISALVVIPLVAYGVTTISRLQLFTQPVWLVLMISPFVAVLLREPDTLTEALLFQGLGGHPPHFNALLFGSACTVAFSMVAQIGEQVDFLRFLPEKTSKNRFRWWSAVIVAGPGWVVLGVIRQLGGALLAYLALKHGVPVHQAHEPTQMYQVAYTVLFDDPKAALTVTVLFVVLSQVKINVTNAYAGSLAWSNFFSRLTHSHPGRVVWLIFNVAIALLLMELGVFSALERILGLFSNVAIAWIGALVADLVVNKPLGLSPPFVEFKRAYLPDINPVGVVSTLGASCVAMAAYLGIFGELPQAFSAFIALGLALVLSPLLARLTRGYYYQVRDRDDRDAAAASGGPCCICQNDFEPEDKAYCPAYRDTICSLCCTLDARCQDACKPGMRLTDQLQELADWLLPARLSRPLRLRLMQFGLLYCSLALLTGLFVGVIYYQDGLLVIGQESRVSQILQNNFLRVYSALLVFLGLATWWLVLNNESRQVAREESGRQTLLLQREIAEHRKTYSQLQEARNLADRANLAKSRFLSDMSHEIRTPLNSILGYAQILRKDPAIPAHRRDAVETIQRSGDHLAALIEDILDISRIEARKFELKPAAIDFPAFIEQLVQMFKPQAEARGLAFRCQLIDALPPCIRGDEKRVGQILINLLGNAIKFTHQGHVLLRVSYSGEIARFQVVDTGAGIPADQMDNIFQPFQRGGNGGGNAVAGAGLGLTISKILAGIMGGELTVASEVGKGSHFTVRLYLPHQRNREIPAAEEDIVGYAGNRRKILIVDDHAEQRTLLHSALAPLGFDIEEAASGEECLSRVTEIRHDLLLLDIAMSGMSGIEVAGQLRAMGYGQPIIMVSANAYAVDRNRASEAGCDDFLAKPIQISALLARIKLHLGLNWIYRGEAKPTPVDVHRVLPPPEVLNELRAAVRMGDLRTLNDRLLALVDLDLAYLPFARNLQTLAREFRLADLRKALGDF